jgi:hypothetical protein
MERMREHDIAILGYAPFGSPQKKRTCGNTLSLYKLRLLNIPKISKLGIDYEEDAKVFEDLIFAHRVLEGIFFLG